MDDNILFVYCSDHHMELVSVDTNFLLFPALERRLQYYNHVIDHSVVMP